MNQYFKFFVLISFTLIVSINTVYAQEKNPQWMLEGPFLEESSASFELPLKTLGTKLYVDVEIGGKVRRFVVDTGSPSMIDTALADELGMDAVGTSQGRDAHGVIIQSKIIQTTIKLGGISFHKTPMFCAPFSALETTKTFIGDGVLGSELLSLGTWQIDLKNSVLRFNTDISNLPFVKNAQQAKLYDFGYPHTPILDVHFVKKARSKAMFDTGSTAYFAISPDDLEGVSKEGGIGRTISGYGSPGGSLGGQAPESDQLQVELKTLSLGGVTLGRVGAVRRELSPSLIGAKVLKHFIVTFDSGSGVVYFSKYNDEPLAQSTFGFTLAFGKTVSIALVWDESAAAKAGLRPGMILTSINGKQPELSNEGIHNAISALHGEKIHLEWNGGSAILTRKSNILVNN